MEMPPWLIRWMQIISKEHLWISIAMVTGGGTQYSMDGLMRQITHPYHWWSCYIPKWTSTDKHSAIIQNYCTNVGCISGKHVKMLNLVGLFRTTAQKNHHFFGMTITNTKFFVMGWSHQPVLTSMNQPLTYPFVVSMFSFVGQKLTSIILYHQT